MKSGGHPPWLVPVVRRVARRQSGAAFPPARPVTGLAVPAIGYVWRATGFANDLFAPVLVPRLSVSLPGPVEPAPSLE